MVLKLDVSVVVPMARSWSGVTSETLQFPCRW